MGSYSPFVGKNKEGESKLSVVFQTDLNPGHLDSYQERDIPAFSSLGSCCFQSFLSRFSAYKNKWDHVDVQLHDISALVMSHWEKQYIIRPKTHRLKLIF